MKSLHRTGLNIFFYKVGGFWTTTKKDSNLLTEWRTQNGFTDVRGQCLYCSKMSKKLNGFVRHNKACKANPHNGKYFSLLCKIEN